MKKIILFSLALAASLPVFANLDGTGYYRVKNYMTNRYASIINNQASVDWAATMVDLSSIQLNSDFSEICCDPGSVLYITKGGAKTTEYDIAAQGTSIHSMIDVYINLQESGKENNGEKLYYAYGSYKDIANRYLGDSYTGTGNIGIMSIRAEGNYRLWYILPIDENSPNYFGVLPTINVNNENYTTMYASFPFSAQSSSMKFYYVKGTKKGMAELVEIEGTVPANTPVVVKCNGGEPASNLLNIGGEAQEIKDNALSGVYFDYEYYGIINATKYDPATMRVLGKCSDGSLGFVTDPELEYVPANKAYITVPANSPAELKCVSSADYEAGVGSINSDMKDLVYSNNQVLANSPVEFTIYNISGQIIEKEVTDCLNISNLSNGLYIISAPGYNPLKVKK